MATQTRILTDSSREVVVLLSNYATTETDVIKIDASALSGAAVGETFHDLTVYDITWSVTGGTVELKFDASTDSIFAYLSGNGRLKPNGGEKYNITNPAATGATGDILLSTKDFGASSAYTIIIHAYKGLNFNRGSDNPAWVQP